MLLLCLIATGPPKRKASGDDRSSSANAEPPTKKVAKVDANAQDAGARSIVETNASQP